MEEKATAEAEPAPLVEEKLAAEAEPAKPTSPAEEKPPPATKAAENIPSAEAPAANEKDEPASHCSSGSCSRPSGPEPEAAVPGLEEEADFSPDAVDAAPTAEAAAAAEDSFPEREPPHQGKKKKKREKE